MGSVWVLFHFSAHTRPIYPTHFAGNQYTAFITATITPIYSLSKNTHTTAMKLPIYSAI